MIKKIIIALFISVVLPINAQNKKDKVLMTIENETVKVSEFLRVYNKNKDIVAEENKKNIDEYLDLFINYKLKLREAYDLKLDTVPSYIKEYNKYKEQLVEPFLKDRNVSEKLVKEAYDRMKQEVKASHILIKVEAHALPKDTLVAYNKLLKAREKIINGEDFAKVAKQFSDDPSAKKNGGDLGYFTTFSMVYPFETAAYNTQVGDVSMPFKTSFGYHIVKVTDKRLSKGEIKVAHIMIMHNKEKPEFSKNQIDDIFQKFKQGEKFDFLAKNYSEDKANASKGGVLRKFSQSKMLPSFADEAFKLENEGDVSEPFKTKFGWHFVKLIKKYPIDSYDKIKDNLTKKIEKGDRSVLVGKSIANRLKKEYKVNLDKNVLDETLSKLQEKDIEVKTLLTIENKNYTSKDLINYFRVNKGKDYKDFVDNTLIEYYKDNLEKDNVEYASTLREYKDGLLLFDLLQKNIWDKAEKDTIGLQNFYNKNATNYTWKKRVKIEIASCTKLEKANLVKKHLSEGKTIKEIKELVNEGPTIHVLFNEGTYEEDSNKLPKEYIIKKGVSEIITEDENHFKIISTLDILPASQKELKDARGKVISDYQDYLEKEWIKNLKAKYKVETNKKVLKKLRKKYK